MYPVNDEYLENVKFEIDYQVHRLRHHPSIIAWAGNNENEAALADNWYNTNTKKELFDNDYRKLYIKTIRTKVLEIEPIQSRPFISSSPSNGIESESENWLSKNPYDPHYGDVHYYNYVADGWDPNSYPITRFMSEFGFQSLPSLSTLLTAYDSSNDLSLFSPLNNHRQHNESGNEELLYEILSHFSLPKLDDFDAIIYLSQLNQAMSLKTGIEVCRRNRDYINPKDGNGLCMGVMYWQLNDVWVAPTWSTVEYGGKWKLGQYFISSAFKTLLISPFYNKITNTLDVYLIADVLETTPIRSHITMNVYDYRNFYAKYNETFEFFINSSSTQIVAMLDLDEIYKKTQCIINHEYFKCLFTFTFDDNFYSSDYYGDNFLFSINKFDNFKFHEVNVTSVKKDGANQFLIDLTTSRISLFVSLDIANSNITGYFSTNGFHMVKPTQQLLYTTFNDNLSEDDVKKYLNVISIVIP